MKHVIPPWLIEGSAAAGNPAPARSSRVAADWKSTAPMLQVRTLGLPFFAGGRSEKRMRSTISTALGLAVVMVTRVGSISHAAPSAPPPPVANLLSVERANVIDDTGAEMWLVTVGISNALSPSMAGSHFEPIYIKDVDVPVEARIDGRWARTEGVIGTASLRHCVSDMHRIQLVVSEKTDSVRIRFKYASALVISGRLTYLSEDLPTGIRTNLPATFWKSAGFVHYGPSSAWKEQKIELPLRLPAVSHNESLQPTTR